ncbi:ARF-binding protein [Coemansia sp. Benny D115]|nr:ARF-binding protein [Coemansia sp. Benny D115]
MAFQFQAAIDELFKPPSRLQTMVDRAVRPELREPDLLLNLDICDLVNKKKGNYPHDAVFALLPYINGRSVPQAQLALTLLDYLVKNCGHAVHYQIATRDFLNDLFRRFPEFQPSLPNPVHYRILEMLREWQLTLCRQSRYKSDLQRINDMYSLLRRKGWRFPEVDVSNAAAVLGPANDLKSREEQEREDMEAMQAKLQELLRRATPKDLREANKLMKIITGYEQSSKRPDYDREWEAKLKEIEVNVNVLLEMLQKMEPTEKPSDTVNELKATCTSNQSRLHKLITDQQKTPAAERSEEEARELARLLAIDGLISEAVVAYDALRSGKQPVFPLSAPQAPENELILLDDDTGEATDAAAQDRPEAPPPKDAAARYKRPGYDAERRAEMQSAETHVTRLEELLQSAQGPESLSADLRRARADCTASLSMLQELAQEQKGYARYNANENRQLARMYMMRDRIQAALTAYGELKNGKRPQISSNAGNRTPGGSELLVWDEQLPDGPANVTSPVSATSDLFSIDFAASSTPAVSTPILTPGMRNTPGLSVPITSTSTFQLAAAPSGLQPMSNPSLPATSLQARQSSNGTKTTSGGNSAKDAFDFSDLLSAAKSIQSTSSKGTPVTGGSSMANEARTTSWGSSPDPDKKQGSNGSLIDFMS